MANTPTLLEGATLDPANLGSMILALISAVRTLDERTAGLNTSGQITGDAPSISGAGSGAFSYAGTLTATGAAYKSGIRSNASIGAAYGSSTFLDPSSSYGGKFFISGENLTSTFNTMGGLTGIYNITGTNASNFPKAGVVGTVGDTTTTADAAVMAYLDGDGGATNARAGFGIMMQNSTGASGFDYGMDLKLQLVTGHETYSQPYKKATIRLENGQWIVALDTAITANTTTTTSPAGSLGMTTHATGVGHIFVSDGAKWQTLV